MTGRPPALIVFGGLPGTGKTTVFRELTRRLAATYLRIDAVEQTLRTAGHRVGAMGYVVATALAAEKLELGRVVVVDCVNPVLASRVGWRQVAAQKSTCVVEIEVVCSDLILHRQRVETRTSDISGLKQPTWAEVVNRDYEPWDREHLVLDTAVSSLDHLLEEAETYVRAQTG
ncbi:MULTISPECIES: AAA family ATPase [unclassified Bradyrhizobium]|uniref:AAA family ATPase n=1 Tax=unclassified Bradyrhizobium TaxID=2631580 RepID=UPI000486495E|nr:MULTISPECIES: AAA family ATPase [unclassified Bradyrhizobium]MCK1398310.1 AAA family ATPase [Bradyrhizobium sp. 39]MCK1751554.1 AAA family ATPase [Bradyrhizobium sp. 135]UPJ34896.1 AAA family ATPase [Bradyrhizobium sp. 4]